MRRAATGSLLLWLALLGAVPAGATPPEPTPARITLNFRDTPLPEAFEMLARAGRMNILLSQGVSGRVSASLVDIGIDQAVRGIAEAAGYVAERRPDAYLIKERSDVDKDGINADKQVRVFKVRHTDPGEIAAMLEKYLSRSGKLTTLADRGLLVVDDLPAFVERIEAMLGRLDAEPRQILIEARILEISLRDNESFGVDWTRFVGDGSFGTRLQADRNSAGLFLDIASDRFETYLNALSGEGRVRTLSTPKLLVLEDQEAEVVVGDRIGFRVTTTINQVTTESVEFLESGVILKVRASVDANQRIMLQIHPEVSTATINEGIPSLNTTEVSTQLLADSGQDIFIGGLIRNSVTDSQEGVPGMRRLPLIGPLFARQDSLSTNTETIVLITPHLIDPEQRQAERRDLERVRQVGAQLAAEAPRLAAPTEPTEPARAEPPPAEPPATTSRWWALGGLLALLLLI